MSTSDLATVDRETTEPDGAFEEVADTLTSPPGQGPVQTPAEPTLAGPTPDGSTPVAATGIEPAEWAARLADLDERLTLAEARAGTTEGRVSTTESHLSEVNGYVAAAHSRLDSTDSAAEAAHSQITTLTERLALVDVRLGSVDGHLVSLDDQITTLSSRAAEHDRALESVKRTIATEVERHTTDALVDAQHSLQLAVNSIAQLALAMSESSRDLTEDVSAESATALLDSFRVDLDAILAQLGFEPLGTTVGATFDPHRHRALKRVTTSDAGCDKTITRVIRDGYLSAGTGRILIFADVEVSRHKP